MLLLVRARSGLNNVAENFHKQDKMSSNRVRQCDFTRVLQEPFQQHQGVAVENATVSDLVHVFNQLPELVATNGISLPAAKNCVLHAVAFHVLGGHAANIPPPPPTSAEARSPAFACTRTLMTEAARFEQRRASLAARVAKGQGGPQAAAAAEELDALLATPLNEKNCCLLRSAGGGAKQAAPPPPPPPASPAEAELARRRACCTALAMGTHLRLGMESWVQKLAGEHDALRQIALHAGISTAVVLPQRPSKEVLELRRLYRAEHVEVLHLRDVIDEMYVKVRSLEQSEARAWRHVESAERSAAATRDGCERRIEEGREVVQARCHHPPARRRPSTPPPGHPATLATSPPHHPAPHCRRSSVTPSRSGRAWRRRWRRSAPSTPSRSRGWSESPRRRWSPRARKSPTTAGT